MIIVSKSPVLEIDFEMNLLRLEPFLRIVWIQYYNTDGSQNLSIIDDFRHG